MTQKKFQISRIQFISPTIETASNIFEIGMGLHSSSVEMGNFRVYTVDDELQIAVQIANEVSRYDWPWNNISFYTSTANLRSIYERLKKTNEKIKFSVWETEDGRKHCHTLRISIGLNAYVIITDRSNSDFTLYYPTEIPETRSEEIYVPLPQNLYGNYKTLIEVSGSILKLDEIHKVMLYATSDFLNEKITFQEFAGISDELSRQYNKKENRRASIARQYFENTDSQLFSALGRVVWCYFYSLKDKKDVIPQEEEWYKISMQLVQRYFEKNKHLLEEK